MDYVYKITSPLGEIYIGQTININTRIKAYKNFKFKKQTKLWNNSQYYNWCPSDSFEIIDECLCGEDKTGSSSTGIVKVCKGVRKSTNNFIWKYNS